MVTHLGASIDFISLFRLQVYPEDMEHESVFEGSSDLRQLPEYRHDNLDDLGVQIVTPSQTISCFGFSRCIIFAMHLDIYYVCRGLFRVPTVGWRNAPA